MYNGPECNTDTEFTSSSTTDNPESGSYGSGMFAGSHHFSVAGGTLTSVTNNYTTTQTVPSDFRMIPMGDINLHHEIHLHYDTGVVDRRHQRHSARRIYSAEIHGQNSDTTVAMYQGNGAEEEWRRDIAKYMSVRHPNIIQICGAASSGDIHATLFHDDLIPFEHFLSTYRHSPILTVYIYAYCEIEFDEIQMYFSSTFQRSLSQAECTFFIRRSTGRSCVDLIPSGTTQYWYGGDLTRLQGFQSLEAPNSEDMVIDSLTLDQYHQICYWALKQARYISISTRATVNLGVVISCSLGHRLEDMVEIASLPNVELWTDECPWVIAGGSVGDVTENGWTRFNVGDVSGTSFWVNLRYLHSRSWLSQANYVFAHLQITSHFEDYVLVNGILFGLIISATIQAPTGYLFLCPRSDLQTGPSSFKWPDCPAYWSFDPSGSERLTREDATRLGFPSIVLRTAVRSYSWDASVYAGLRQFHRAKGFDPDSQDIAWHLGEPLYQLTFEIDAPFAYVGDEEFRAAEKDWDPVNTDNRFEDTQTPANEDEMPKSAAGGEEAVSAGIHEEMPTESWTFQFLMHVQLSLILFLALSRLYI